MLCMSEIFWSRGGGIEILIDFDLIWTYFIAWSFCKTIRHKFAKGLGTSSENLEHLLLKYWQW